MKTTCPHCEKTAKIYETVKVSPTRSTLLLQCTDIKHCGSRTLSTVSLKKSLAMSLLPQGEQCGNDEGLVSDNFRINCPHCGKPATLYSRYNITGITSDIYCKCHNACCGARFVVDLAYQQTLLPSISGIHLMAYQVLKSATPKIFSEFQMSLDGFF